MTLLPVDFPTTRAEVTSYLDDIVVYVGDQRDYPTIDYSPKDVEILQGKVEVQSIPKGRHHKPPKNSLPWEYRSDLPRELTKDYTFYPDPSDLPIPLLGVEMDEDLPIPRGGLRGFLSRVGKALRGLWQDDVTRTWEVTLINHLGQTRKFEVDTVGVTAAEKEGYRLLMDGCPMWSQYQWATLKVEMVWPIPQAPIPDLPGGVTPL